MTSKNRQRLSELDGLRGIAALAVVVFHYFYQYDSIYGHSFEISQWTRFGSYGVHLFFMVSGFVIFWTISKVDHPLDFIWSRFSRLYPVFWAAVFLTSLVVFTFGLPGREPRLTDLIVNYFMIHEYLGFKHVDGVYWTLSLELAFYFWMLVLLLLDQTRHIEKWLLGWVVSAALLTYPGLGLELPGIWKKFFLLDYIELFAAGICFYILRQGKGRPMTYLVLAASSLSLFAEYPVGIAFSLLLFYAVFYLAITHRLGFLATKPIVFVGTISYSLYLIHQNIGYVIINGFYANDLPATWAIVTAFTTSFLLAVLLTFKVERPAMQQLRRYYRDHDIRQIAGKLLSFGRN